MGEICVKRCLRGLVLGGDQFGVDGSHVNAFVNGACRY
jgi:hypothetical protein